MRKMCWLLAAAMAAPAAHGETPPPAFARADIEQRTARMFDLTDRNHDGRMSKAEYVAAAVAIAKARGGGTPTDKGLALVGAQFDAFDVHRQGAIARSDFIAEKMARFDAMDLDHDGVVGPKESHQAGLALQREVDAQRKAAKHRLR